MPGVILYSIDYNSPAWDIARLYGPLVDICTLLLCIQLHLLDLRLTVAPEGQRGRGRGTFARRHFESYTFGGWRQSYLFVTFGFFIFYSASYSFIQCQIQEVAVNDSYSD